MNQWLKKLDAPSRRQFVTCAAQSFLGVGMLAPIAQNLQAATPRSSRAKSAKNIIYLYMNGGMSHLDTFDPKSDSDVGGPLGTVSTNADGVTINENFKSLAKHMDQVALVRSLSSKQGAHEPGRYFVRTSYAPLATIRHPAMGAWLLKMKPNGGSETLPNNVRIGGGGRHPGAGFLSSKYTPILVGNPEAGLADVKLPEGIHPNQLDVRLKLAKKFDTSFMRTYDHKDVNAYTGFYEDAVRLMKSRDLKAFDLSNESDATRKKYGSSRVGQGLLLARRLVQHGVRHIEIEYGSWDMHNDVFANIPTRVAPLDQALGALFSELKATGLIDETIVVLATEFGRTPKINERTGRDHFPKAFSGFIAGAGIQGGQAYGRTDEKGTNVVDNLVEVPDFNATIAAALGIDTEEITIAPNGRPFTVAHKGKPVEGLLA